MFLWMVEKHPQREKVQWRAHVAVVPIGPVLGPSEGSVRLVHLVDSTDERIVSKEREGDGDYTNVSITVKI